MPFLETPQISQYSQNDFPRNTMLCIMALRSTMSVPTRKMFTRMLICRPTEASHTQIPAYDVSFDAHAQTMHAQTAQERDNIGTRLTFGHAQRLPHDGIKIGILILGLSRTREVTSDQAVLVLNADPRR